MNPAQFSPTEDLSTYPRPLSSDLALLASLARPANALSSDVNEGKKGIGALFLPPISALYPLGITTNVEHQRGTFVEVKGLQDQMEGGSRKGFFRGVATVVLKLFNIVQVSLSTPKSLEKLIETSNDPANASLLRPKGYSASAPPPASCLRPPSYPPHSLESDHSSHLS